LLAIGQTDWQNLNPLLSQLCNQWLAIERVDRRVGHECYPAAWQIGNQPLDIR